MGKLRKGILSQEEVAVILEQSAYKTDEELAVILNRSVKQIEIGRKRAALQKKEHAKILEDKEMLNRYTLATKNYWLELQKQFNTAELRLAQDIWFELYKQFGEDVTPTEELQMIDIITVQILINRNMEERQTAQKTIARLEVRLNQEFAKPLDDQDPDFISNLTNEINIGAAGQQARTSEYKGLLEKKQMLMKDVKGTRDQRYKEIKDSKDTFFVWIKTHNERILRQEEAHIMELNKIAMEKEKQRLSEYHTYMDGAVDRPFLNAESVMLDQPTKPGVEDE